MVLQGSGMILFSELQTEFGGSYPILMSEYATQVGVGANALIRIGTNFFGKSANAAAPTIVENSITKQATYISGSNYYYAFTATSGTNTITFASATTCDILVIGGGASGGTSIGGGGGAGGVVYVVNKQLAAGAYTVKVGAGGQSGGNSATGTGNYGGDSYVQLSGTDITIDGFSVRGRGGGYGGSYYNNASNVDYQPGKGGGSGGGASDNNSDTNYFGGATNQGNTYWNGSAYIAGGSAGQNTQSGQYYGSGGGGMGSAGATYKDGYTGVQNSITGTAQWYAAGGGGGANNSSSGVGGNGGGRGGRANIGSYYATDGSNNTGSGGGGGGYFYISGDSYAGGAGGSGVVIFKFSTTIVLPSVVMDGLVFFIDPSISSSYSGSGSNVYNLISGQTNAHLKGSFSNDSTTGGIRLYNTTAWNTNVSYLQLASNVGPIWTVSTWFNNLGTQGTYIFDARSGMPNGYVNSGDMAFSSFYQGTQYKNGGSAGQTTLTSWPDSNVWQNITNIFRSGATDGSTPGSDDITFFGRVSGNTSMDCVFGPILVYNRAITQAENTTNFNAIKARYGNLYERMSSSNSCVAMLGLKLMRSGYTGPVVQIRRSDGTTKDFYADFIGNLGDTVGGTGTTPTTWLTGYTGTVATWYDQSGNTNNFTQSTTSYQPSFTNNTITFNGSTQYFERAYTSALNPASFSWVVGCTWSGSNNNNYATPLTSRHDVHDGGTNTTYGYIIYKTPTNSWTYWTGTGSSVWGNHNTSVNLSANTRYKLTAQFSAGTMKSSINGTITSTSLTYSPNTVSPTRIGAGTTETTPGYYWPGTIDTVIFFNTSISDAERNIAMYTI